MLFVSLFVISGQTAAAYSVDLHVAEERAVKRHRPAQAEEVAARVAPLFLDLFVDAKIQQSLKSFRAATQGRRASGTRWALRIVGELEDDLLIQQVREFVEIFFQTPCVLLPAATLEYPVVRVIEGKKNLSGG